MNCSSFFTQIQDDTTIVRNGGIILKGQSRSSRQPVHMILLVDTSGSMESNNKLSSVQKSITLMLSLLSPDDRLSLVTFADDSKIFLSCVSPTVEERQAIQYRVNNLKADGSTNMSAGLLQIRSLLEPPSSGRKQGLLLLTDGHANLGVHTEVGLIHILNRIQSDNPGLSLTTVAYGVDHNTQMLTNLAKAGGGAYNVVTNLEDVATVFGDILGGLMSVSAQKVEIQLPPGATTQTSYRTETDPSGMTTVYIGDLYADAEVTVLFQSAPSFGPVRVKGTDMTTLDLLDVLVTPTLIQTLQDIPVSLVMARYRQKVVDLLASLRSNQSPATAREEAESLLKEIQDDDRIINHPLKPILMEDIQKSLEVLQRGHMTQNETVEMAQHSAYYGMSRGLRSMTTHAPPRNSRMPRQRGVATLSPPPEDEVRPPSPPASATPSITSPFANRLQTQIATVMRYMSSEVRNEEPHQQ